MQIACLSCPFLTMLLFAIGWIFGPFITGGLCYGPFNSSKANKMQIFSSRKQMLDKDA